MSRALCIGGGGQKGSRTAGHLYKKEARILFYS